MLTDFHGEPSKPETRQNHLAQSEWRSEARKEAHRQDTQQIEEQTHQNGIDKSQIEGRNSQDSNGKGAGDHVRGQPLRPVSGEPKGPL